MINEIPEIRFAETHKSIHEVAVAKLMYGSSKEVCLVQGNLRYKVSGGDNGSISYRSSIKRDWVLIANWSFYKSYLVVRYKRHIWLRCMYETLFGYMNFKDVTFGDFSIGLTDSSDEKISGRRLRLSPPGELGRVVSERFNIDANKLELTDPNLAKLIFS